MTLYTVGHSTRTTDELIALLAESAVRSLVDVRRFPASRRLPHFNKPELSAALAKAGIGYEHMEALGGRRAARPDSRNTAWRNEGFRGYADYMETAAFRAAADRLASRATATPTAVMCAEAWWVRCHRSLIADFFKAAGWEVLHIVAPGRVEPHPFTSVARVVDGSLTYVTQPELPL